MISIYITHPRRTKNVLRRVLNGPCTRGYIHQKHTWYVTADLTVETVAPKCSRAEQRKVKASGARRFAPKEQCKSRPEQSTPAACRHEEQQHDQQMGQTYSFKVPCYHFCFLLEVTAWNGPCARCFCHVDFVMLPYCKIYADMWQNKKERKWTYFSGIHRTNACKWRCHQKATQLLHKTVSWCQGRFVRRDLSPVPKQGW